MSKSIHLDIIYFVSMHDIKLTPRKTLFPFAKTRLRELGKKMKKVIVVELNNGQMADDVELSISCKVPVLRYNWLGGMVPSTLEIVDKVKNDV